MRRKKFRRHHQQRNKNFRFQRPDERKFLAFLSSPRDRLFGDGPNAWKFARSWRSGPECRDLRPFGARREGNLSRRSQVNKEKKFLGNACWKARPKWNSIGNVSDNVRRTEMVFGARWRQSRRPDDSVGPEKHGSTWETIKNRRNFRSNFVTLNASPGPDLAASRSTSHKYSQRGKSKSLVSFTYKLNLMITVEIFWFFIKIQFCFLPQSSASESIRNWKPLERRESLKIRSVKNNFTIWKQSSAISSPEITLAT